MPLFSQFFSLTQFIAFLPGFKAPLPVRIESWLSFIPARVWLHKIFSRFLERKYTKLVEVIVSVSLEVDDTRDRKFVYIGPDLKYGKILKI